jgi:hypothetical protein
MNAFVAGYPPLEQSAGEIFSGAHDFPPFFVTFRNMQSTNSIIFLVAGISLLIFGWVLLRSRKTSLLAHRYSDALLAENNGEVERAIQLYQEALRSGGHDRKTGDKHLLDDIERRLKTLQISTDFEKSFKPTILKKMTSPLQQVSPGLSAK